MFLPDFCLVLEVTATELLGEVSTIVLKDASFSFGWHLLLFQQNVITL